MRKLVAIGPIGCHRVIMENSFELHCFGVGDGWPGERRHHSSYLFRFKSAVILMDCGEPLSASYKAAKLDYDLFDAILISHLHFDHIGGFFMFMQGLWLEQRQKELPVFLPSDGITPIRDLMRVACIFDELFNFKWSLNRLTDRKSFDINGIRITPFANTHLASLRDSFEKLYPQRYESFSFILEGDSLRIAHSADVGGVSDLACLTEQPLDLLVCEMAHLEMEELFRFLSKCSIQRIVFIHLSRKQKSQIEEIKREASICLKGKTIHFATEGDTYRIP